ncbi:Dienelactone hydrolase [Mycena kentingensis (nom. inval.)]|nr:Dienelactone hydrolase [Mycena kentingensis (nom. inval.)]
MLIEKTFHDVPSALDGGRPIRVFVISPKVAGYPQAKFPSKSSIHPAVPCVLMHRRRRRLQRNLPSHWAGRAVCRLDREPGIRCRPPQLVHPPTTNLRDQNRFHMMLKAVAVLPTALFSQHRPGTDRGNKYKIEKSVAAYDEDATLSIDLLASLSNCNGRIAATGMCLGGHLAFRAAFDPRVLASVCFFATDIHSASLGKGGDDSLVRVNNGELAGKGELMIFGKQDTHVPRSGRDLIRKTLEDANVAVSFLEVQAQHAFIRDDSSKGRWDAALTRSLFAFMMEVFERTVGRDLGPRINSNSAPEHVC